ncbi:MAG: iron-sulfur cluster assembly accessory protein [Gammaproteobacteria bacterium]|nr:iron-sulfur cluster assembly accessory protein [Gammaproteobacteria bacterium]
MSITLTESAAQHVNKMLQQRGEGLGLRLGTKKSGCTGFAYVVDYADEIHDDDVTFESLGITLVVDKKSLSQIDGMTLDYQKSSVLNHGFDFINPNIQEMCGCGESFSV